MPANPHSTPDFFRIGGRQWKLIIPNAGLFAVAGAQAGVFIRYVPNRNSITIDSSHLSETDLKLMRELLLRDSPNQWNYIIDDRFDGFAVFIFKKEGILLIKDNLYSNEERGDIIVYINLKKKPSRPSSCAAQASSQAEEAHHCLQNPMIPS